MSENGRLRIALTYLMNDDGGTRARGFVKKALTEILSDAFKRKDFVP